MMLLVLSIRIVGVDADDIRIVIRVAASVVIY